MFSSFNNDVSIRKTDDASWLYKYINKSGILTIYLFEGNDFFCYNPFDDKNNVDYKKGIFSSPIENIINNSKQILLKDSEGIMYCFSITK